MKAQIALITKPFVLVLTIVILIIFINTIFSGTNTTRTKERQMDMRSIATDTLLILSNSEQCLAYRTETLGGYANIVDLERLDLLSEDYNGIEPICARNFDFGWRASVMELDKTGAAINVWNFGATDFSKDSAFRQYIVTDMPIAIRYSRYDIRPGKLEIKFMDGELEELAGLLDKACYLAEKTGKDISLSYGAYPEGDGICMGSGTNKACRELLCKVDMPKLNRGSYYLVADYNDNIVKVII